MAVVTLFRKQVLKIRQLLRKIGLGAVRVGTVDDYQGQEEKVVIISTVLSHSHPHAPALFSSAKRFNVAITRAMALLIVVANPLALYDDTTWRPLLKYATDKGAYRGCAHPLCMEGAEGTAADEMALLKALRGELGSADSKRTLGAGHAAPVGETTRGPRERLRLLPECIEGSNQTPARLLLRQEQDAVLFARLRQGVEPPLGP